MYLGFWQGEGVSVMLNWFQHDDNLLLFQFVARHMCEPESLAGQWVVGVGFPRFGILRAQR